jgi:membrane protease YdiL (CAAX protease family)
MQPTSISDRTRVFEITAVVVTALGKFIFVDFLHWQLPFIVVTMIFWCGYIIYRSKRKHGITKYWGFRTDNFSQTIRIILPFAIVALSILIFAGIFQDTLNITWHIIPLLILYPIWGVIQQFLVIALTVGNLDHLKTSKIPKLIIVLLAAALFGLIHYPYVWLIIGTFVLGIFYGLIYLRHRNLYALGIFHGWLGAIFFYTVVNRDPFLEVFGQVLNIPK